MSALNPAETYLTCPYDRSHRLLSWRMQKHLDKCKVNHPDAKVVTCNYNNTHIVPETELAIHHETCKDRYKLDTFIFVPENTDRNKYPVKNIPVLQDGDETWDDEDTPTYNAEEYCKNNKILRRLDVASAATRRTFRLEERMRFQQLGDQETKQQNQQDPFKIPRLPVEQSLCVAPQARTIDPQPLINDFKKLNLRNHEPSPSASIDAVKNVPTKETKKTEDDFILVGYGRGRGRRGTPKK